MLTLLYLLFALAIFGVYLRGRGYLSSFFIGKSAILFFWKRKGTLYMPT